MIWFQQKKLRKETHLLLTSMMDNLLETSMGDFFKCHTPVLNNLQIVIRNSKWCEYNMKSPLRMKRKVELELK